jgi:hypothetical protein
VLVAHREAGRLRARLVRLARLRGGGERKNRRPLPERGVPGAVDYGIFNSERFVPPAPRAARRCASSCWARSTMRGRAPTPRRPPSALLPPEVRARCRAAPGLLPHAARRDGHVVAHPWLPADAIPGLLQGMHVMICPSRDEVVMRETFSQAMVQGMLSGLPRGRERSAHPHGKTGPGRRIHVPHRGELTEHMTRLVGIPACASAGRGGAAHRAGALRVGHRAVRRALPGARS